MNAPFRTICLALLVRVCAAATDYATVGIQLDQFVEREMRDKEIDGVAVALVDDQTVVWARG